MARITSTRYNVYVSNPKDNERVCAFSVNTLAEAEDAYKLRVLMGYDVVVALIETTETLVKIGE